MLALIGNVLWFVLGGGFFAFLSWVLTGALWAITIVGLPYASASFRVAGFAAFPFGQDLVEAEDLGEENMFGTGCLNVLWVIFAGIWLTIGHVIAGVILCITIIGIPFGLAHFKLAEVCFAPLGKRAVPSDLAAALRVDLAREQLHRLRGRSL